MQPKHRWTTKTLLDGSVVKYCKHCKVKFRLENQNFPCLGKPAYGQHSDR